MQRRSAPPGDDVELVAEASSPRRRPGLLWATSTIIAMAFVGLSVLGQGDDPDTRPPDVTTPTSPTLTPAVARLLETMPASPIDGKQTQRLPVAVAPQSELVDGQLVTVLAKGYAPGERVGVVMCAAEAALEGVTACDLGAGFGNVTYADANREGFVLVDVAVRQLVTTPLTGPIDCTSGPERCLVAVGAVADYDRSGGSFVGFSGQPPFPEPAMTVSPPGPYMPDQIVDLVATGLLAPREVQVQLCRGEQCVVLVRGRVGADGTFAASIGLPGAFILVDGTALNCDGGCELRLEYLGLSEATDAPVPAPIPVDIAAIDATAPSVPATVPDTAAPPSVPLPVPTSSVAPDAPVPTVPLSTVGPTVPGPSPVPPTVPVASTPISSTGTTAPTTGG